MTANESTAGFTCGFCGHQEGDHYWHPPQSVINERRRAGRPFCHCCGS